MCIIVQCSCAKTMQTGFQLSVCYFSTGKVGDVPLASVAQLKSKYSKLGTKGVIVDREHCHSPEDGTEGGWG